MMVTPKYKAYQFGACTSLTEAQMDRLIGFFSQPPPASDTVLGGRDSIGHHRIEELGPVVIKHYKRGGLIGRLVRRNYIRLGKSRSRLEFELLRKARKLGINVPEPLVCASRGWLIYRAWLVTVEIESALPLARLSSEDEKRARRVMPAAIEQISRLIENRIIHVDLHPGNVLVDGRDRIFLLDFDKGKFHRGDKNKLRDRYLKRWQRAVSKHGLPDYLNEMLEAGLQGIKWP
jgi:3-deoxy-D-manno-octulosonic acid kinase